MTVVKSGIDPKTNKTWRYELKDTDDKAYSGWVEHGSLKKR